MAVATSPAQSAGSLFGMPGITRPLSGKENNDQTSVTLSSASQTPVTGLVPFKQSDVITYYELQLKWANTVTAGSATVSTSPYFPYNILGPGSLQMQNAYSTLQWKSGIDLAIWQNMRPFQQTQYRDVNYQIPRSNAYSAGTSQITASNYTSASTTINVPFELPVSMWFDLFVPLDANGSPVRSQQGGPMAPIRALVTPQFMSGTQRVVMPALTYNPIALVTTSANLDAAPFSSTGTQTGFSATGTVTQGIRRNGYYQPRSAADSPAVYNWQYVRQAYVQSLAGVSQKQIPINFSGQILSVGLRMFDPSSGSVGGAAIPLANVSQCQLQYGPGLFRFDDTPVDMQRRYVSQHGVLPFTEGLILWDMALDPFGRLTNQYALNTLNTSGVQANLVFTGSQSSTAYAVVLVEGLQWVTQG